MLYFAYGSNLDEENWSAWCEAKGYDARSIEPLGPAWLPDFEPVFHYQSRLRKGGALDVQERQGTATPGALFVVHDWDGLDAKEGVSGAFYRPIEVTALTSDGRAHPATTYTVCAPRVGEFVAPGPEYREAVLRGLRRFGHEAGQFESAAAGIEPPSSPANLFVYGTLMSHERNHSLIATHVMRAIPEAEIRGAALVRINWYPGLILGDASTVYGEVLELDDPHKAFAELDPYEDFHGYEALDSLYRRTLVRVLTNGAERLAWTYVYLGERSGLPVIESGRWVAP